jgi:hypothetical protein
LIKVGPTDPADFIPKFNSELVEPLLDVIYDLFVSGIRQGISRSMEDLPALRAAIYQLEKTLSGFTLVRHYVLLLFQRNGIGICDCKRAASPPM